MPLENIPPMPRVCWQVAGSLEQLSQSCVAHCQEFRVEQLAAQA